MQNDPSPQLAAFLPQNNMDTVLINQLSTGIREAILINILLSINTALTTGAVGGVGGVFAGNYGGNPPPFQPNVTAAIAMDTSTGTLWQWYNGTWH